ncbi:MAG: cytidine deaminase [Calditrichaeota bacterium]|nr:MAG: cytidine deaminase [Calditrichota bacterium]
MSKQHTRDALDVELSRKALEARQRALAPFSQFRVGAALSTADGKVFEAGNIESSSYSLTLCAERVALFKALSEGEREFAAIAVAADTEEFCSPCGACRQVLWDYAPDLRVILVNKRGKTRVFQLAELLPEAFDKRLL